MGDNGELKKDELKPEASKQPEPLKEIIMTIKMDSEGTKVEFPFLADKVMTYGFLKLAEKTLDGHYQMQNSRIIKEGNINNRNILRDFLRRK